MWKYGGVWYGVEWKDLQDWKIELFCLKKDVMFVLRIVLVWIPCKRLQNKKMFLIRHSPEYRQNLNLSQKKIQTRLKSVLNSDVLLSITCNDQTQRQRVQKARWFTRRPVTQNRWYRSCCVGWFLFVSRQTIHTT